MTLRIVGAGLGRTGTSSLKIALEQLGLGRCYHMSEVGTHPAHIGLWLDAANGKPDWDRLLGDYAATVDYPACTFWRELAEFYPDSKVLLSVRDPMSWFESTQATILSRKMNDFIRDRPLGKMIQRVIWDTLDNRMDDRDFMTSHFERHIEAVKAAIPGERLLVYEVQQGWEPLCEFLGMPIPDTEFPRVNTRDETRALIEKMIAGGAGEPEA
jgi:hypothetical protein